MVFDVAKLTREDIELAFAWQNKREAKEREILRAAVAKSAAPLPPYYVEALLWMNDGHTRELMQSHPGFKLAERRTSYLESLAIMEQCLQDLLRAIITFEKAAIAEGSTLLQSAGKGELDRRTREIKKEVFATANAAASLVDHTRRVTKEQPLQGFSEKLTECFGTDGLHDFVIALRVMLQHLHNVGVGWSVSQSFRDGSQAATFYIRKKVVQRIIQSAPERFDRPADAAMLSYVASSKDNIDLREVFNDYRARMAKFHGWMKRQLESETLIALRDYDSILQKKRSADSLMTWKALMGNWLNWKVPPDPHKHLPRILSLEQLAEIYKLPRNSKAQADLAIKFVDDRKIIDDDLRKQVYELFERAPPEADAAE